RTVCSMGDAEALRSLLLQAGFRDARISIQILVMRFASVETFVPEQFAATPFAGTIAALDANARSALLEDVRMALRSYTDDAGVAVPHEAHGAVAHTEASRKAGRQCCTSRTCRFTLRPAPLPSDARSLAGV